MTMADDEFLHGARREATQRRRLVEELEVASLSLSIDRRGRANGSAQAERAKA